MRGERARRTIRLSNIRPHSENLGAPTDRRLGRSAGQLLADAMANLPVTWPTSAHGNLRIATFTPSYDVNSPLSWSHPDNIQNVSRCDPGNYQEGKHGLNIEIHKFTNYCNLAHTFAPRDVVTRSMSSTKAVLVVGEVVQ